MASELTLEKILLETEIPVQHDLALMLIEFALPAWLQYMNGKEAISFYDGVGNCYEIKADIIARAISAIKKERGTPGSQTTLLQKLGDEFVGPILSIDRMDWEPPYAADRLFCATYNLLQLYTTDGRHASENAQLNLVINQVADSLLTSKLKTLQELNMFIANLRANHKKTYNRSGDNAPARAPGKVE